MGAVREVTDSLSQVHALPPPLCLRVASALPLLTPTPCTTLTDVRDGLSTTFHAEPESDSYIACPHNRRARPPLLHRRPRPGVRRPRERTNAHHDDADYSSITHHSSITHQADDDLARVADTICFHAQRVLGCAEACLYVAPPAAAEGGERPLYRVRNRHACAEDVTACSHTVLGAAASPPIKEGSLVGSAAGTLGITLIKNAKQDPRRAM